MLNCVERFGKIQFKEDNFLLGGLALMDILKRPSEAVLNRSPFDETILVAMNNLEDNLLQPISEELGD